MDLEIIEKYKHLIPKLYYQEICFKLQPQNYYTVINEPCSKEGLYILYEKDNIVYIGKSENIKSRVNQHKKDKIFDSVQSILFIDNANIDIYEPYLINKYKPKYNKEFVRLDYCINLPEIILNKKEEQNGENSI